MRARLPPGLSAALRPPRSPSVFLSALRLARWPNALTAAAGVLIGAWWAGWGAALPIALTTLAAIALTAAANGWNDLADVGIDILAHPKRPLASGALSVSTAERIAMGAATAAVVCASAVSASLGIATVVVLLLMRLYSPWIKRMGVPGNVVVAALASLPFVYGSYAAGVWQRGLPLVLIAVPLHFARELAKDLDDREADRFTRRTLPVVAGVRYSRVAIVLAIATFAIALAVGLAPLVRSPALLFAALLPAMVALAFATARMMRGRPGSPAFFKLAMVCAMAALLVARA